MWSYGLSKGFSKKQENVVGVVLGLSYSDVVGSQLSMQLSQIFGENLVIMPILVLAGGLS